ncbi:hypothetical protein [Streptomyces malaysiensis]|nr:hypothetical protein [Streptomyces samsunensis]
MSVNGSPQKGENGPDKKAYRWFAGLALRAAFQAALRVLFERFWL